MRWHEYHVHTFDYVIKGIIRECRNHVPNEVIGFLIGMYCQWNGEYFTLIDDYIPVKGAGNHYHVIMDAGAVADAIRILEKKYNDARHLIVGWYHSHPGYGLFLSDIDVTSQITFFNQPYHVALVIDPLKIKYGFFKLSTNGKPIKVSHAVWREVHE
ncbi:MAG: Mov34/MPN/PAD-1 family protein [Candidatus Bathyarchaeia archaeon]